MSGREPMTEDEIFDFFDRHYPDWLPWGGILRHVSIRPLSDDIVQAGPVLSAPGEICFSRKTDPFNEASAYWLSTVASTQDGDIYLETDGQRHEVSLSYVRLFFRALQEAHDRLTSDAEREALSIFRERAISSFSRLVTEIRRSSGVVEVPHTPTRFFHRVVSLPCGDILMPIAAPEMRKPGPLFVGRTKETGLLLIPMSYIMTNWAIVNWPSGKLALAYGDNCSNLFSQMISFFCRHEGLSGHDMISVSEKTRPFIDNLVGADDFDALYPSILCPLMKDR